MPTINPPPAGPGFAYTAIMVLAIATAILLKRRGDRALPLPAAQRWGIALGAFCGAMIGSKLPFVLADWEGLLSGRASDLLICDQSRLRGVRVIR